MAIRRLWQYPILASPVSTAAGQVETIQADKWHPEQNQPSRNHALRRLAVAALIAAMPTVFLVGEPIAAAAAPEPLNQEPQLRAPVSNLSYTYPSFSFVPAPTRFYLPSTGVAAVSPGFGAWDVLGSGMRRRMVTTRISSGMSANAHVDEAVSGRTYMWLQYVSDTLAAQTISGTFKGQVRCSEDSVDANHDQVTLRLAVYSNDGSTLRGTLLSLGQYGSTNEYSLEPTLTNRFIANGDALTTVAAELGDRIVAEFGTRPSTLPTSVNALIRGLFGDDSSTDLPEDETTTASNNPWVEFSGTLVFQDVPLPLPLNQEPQVRARVPSRTHLYPGVFDPGAPVTAAIPDHVQAAIEQPRPRLVKRAHLAPSFFFDPRPIVPEQVQAPTEQPLPRLTIRRHGYPSFFFQEAPAVALFDTQLSDPTYQPRARVASRVHLYPTFFFLAQLAQDIPVTLVAVPTEQPQARVARRAYLAQAFFFQEDPVAAVIQVLDQAAQPQSGLKNVSHAYPYFFYPESQAAETIYLPGWYQPASQPDRNHRQRQIQRTWVAAAAPSLFVQGEPIVGATFITFGDITRFVASPGVPLYFEVIMATTNGAEMAQARLYNITDAAVVSGSTISTTSTTFTRVRSSSLTLAAAAKEYRVEFNGSPGGPCVIKSGDFIFGG